MQRFLLIAGTLLLFLGLLNGALPMFVDNRLALSSHLAAIAHATVILVYASLWNQISLGSAAKKAVSIAFVASQYLIWIALLIAALMGLNSVGDSNVLKTLAGLASAALIVATFGLLLGALNRSTV